MKMIAVIAVLFGFASIINGSNVTVAVAKLLGTQFDTNIQGFIYFNWLEDMGMVNMTVNITGVTYNRDLPHGIHIHQFGDLSNSTGDAPGAHWNSNGEPHACPENATRQIGDTGNWDVDTNGNILQSKMLDLIQMMGTNSLIGFGIILHNFTDNCVTVASNGGRMAQGVIGIANPVYHGNASQNLASPDTANALSASAICNFQTTSSSSQTISGWVRFDQASPSATTYVTAMINGLTLNSVHGFHIHQWGDLTLGDATSAGSHYTGPYYNSSSTHSIPGSGYAHHVGDMGNLYYYEGTNGTAYYSNSFDSFGLWGSANPVIGRAVVLHLNKDDCSQPVGNAGARIGVCVIGNANPAYGGSVVVPDDVPTAQNSSACVPPAAMTTGFVSSSSIALIASFSIMIIALMF